MEVNAPNKAVIVYSALHTGTWFACSALASAKELHIVLEDRWVREKRGDPLEHQPMRTVDLDWMKDLITKQAAVGATIPKEVEAIVFQAHQRDVNTHMYRAICKEVPGLPVVIPMRDPLLSINTRVWREVGTLDRLRAESYETRRNRARNQLGSIKRLLSIPSGHVMLFPIDIPALMQEANRIQQVEELIEYCDLTETEDTHKFAVDWQPFNQTSGGANHERKHHPIIDKEFEGIKANILAGKMGPVKEALSVEYKELVSCFYGQPNLIDRLKELGYKNLPWWY